MHHPREFPNVVTEKRAKKAFVRAHLNRVPCRTTTFVSNVSLLSAQGWAALSKARAMVTPKIMFSFIRYTLCRPQKYGHLVTRPRLSPSLMSNNYKNTCILLVNAVWTIASRDTFLRRLIAADRKDATEMSAQNAKRYSQWTLQLTCS